MIQQLEFDQMKGIPIPSQNSRLFGHESIIRFLQRMRSENRLHHALLFKGVKGSGKATLAFQFTWNILADINDNFVFPETSSKLWRDIGWRSHPNLLYISRNYDVKSRKFRESITVEDVRRIASFLHNTVSDNGWRIIIIDSADDMNRSADNALLKTLEEPPDKTLFILISHSSGRLPPTIRSRCQPIVFRPLGDIPMRKALTYLAGAVGFDESTPQQEIIRHSEGSVRRAILILTSDGLEIIQAIDKVFISPMFPVSSVHRLASTLCVYDAAVQFDFFLDHLTAFLAKSACDAVFSGQSEKAVKLSQLWQKIQHDTTKVLAYNLDKKQFIIIILHKIYSFLKEAA